MSTPRMPLSQRPTFLPDEISRREFATVFRGYDPAEVRTFLNQVSEQISEVSDRVAALQKELVSSQERVKNPELDEETVTRLLGEQTAQILRSAREAAADTRARAEEEVSTSLREAHEVTTRMREEAETLLASRTEEAETMAETVRNEANEDAARVRAEADQYAGESRARSDKEFEEAHSALDAEMQAAHKQLTEEIASARHSAENDMRNELSQARKAAQDIIDQSRAEAQDLVSRTQQQQEELLANLIRKRKIAVAQVEELRAGRSRLLQAYKMVRTTLDDVTVELEKVEAEARNSAEAAGLKAADSQGIQGENLDEEIELVPIELSDDVSDDVISLISESESTPASVSDDDNEVTDITDQGDSSESEKETGSANFKSESDAQPPGNAQLNLTSNGDVAEDESGSQLNAVGVMQRSENQTNESDLLRKGSSQSPFDFESVKDDDEFGNAPIVSDLTDSETQSVVQPVVIDAQVVSELGTYSANVQTASAAEPEVELQARKSVSRGIIIGEAFSSDVYELDAAMTARRDASVSKTQTQFVRRVVRVLQDEREMLATRLRNGDGQSVQALIGSEADHASTYSKTIAKTLRESVRAGAACVQNGKGVSKSTVEHTANAAARVASAEIVGELRSQLVPVLERLIDSEEFDPAAVIDALSGPYDAVSGQYLNEVANDSAGGAFDQGIAFARS